MSFAKTQNISNPRIIKPILLNALDGSLKIPPLTLSHHLEMSPIFSFGSKFLMFELDINRFNRLFGDGSDLGINISYAVQEEPKGLADAFIVGEDFIGNNKVSLILGDNLFYGNDLSSTLQRVKNQQEGATIFCNKVKHPERYGVLNLDSSDKPESIIEKPSKPKSNLAVTGLYYYDEKVVDFAKDLKPSKRGELEISSINQLYLDMKMLKVEILGRGFAWLDTGTYESLLEANQFVASLQERQGFKISCPEEIAWRLGFINSEDLLRIANKIGENDYSKYLLGLPLS